MKKIKQDIKSWITIFLTILALSVITVFAANWYDSLTVNVWDRLTATKWNLVAKATVPTGAVMAFYGSSCPDWWVKADGSWDEKKVDGTLWNLDLRWEFVRWWIDTKTWVDDGRILGSLQLGTKIYDQYWSNAIQPLVTVTWDNNTNETNVSAIQPTISTWLTNQSFSSVIVRPRNIALLYCVKN